MQDTFNVMIKSHIWTILVSKQKQMQIEIFKLLSMKNF